MILGKFSEIKISFNNNNTSVNKNAVSIIYLQRKMNIYFIIIDMVDSLFISKPKHHFK